MRFPKWLAFPTAGGVAAAAVVVVAATTTVANAESASPVTYGVTVAGESIPVEATGVGAYAGFSLSTPVTVVITVNRDIRSAAIRPTALGITPRFEGGRMEFVLQNPAYLSIEVNGDLTMPLFLFADQQQPESVAPTTPGVRYLNPGVHTGDINLGTDETLYLARGAVLKGQVNIVGSEDAFIDNVRILGYGVIDAREAGHRPVRVRYATNVEINGPTVLNRAAWTIAAYATDRLHIFNTKVISSEKTSDGIGILGSTNAVVNRVFVRSGDDSIVIKSGKLGNNWPFRDVSNIRISNAVIFNGPYGNGLEIGYELSGIVTGIRYSNIDIIHKLSDIDRPFRRAAISIHNDGNADVSNVEYRDIRIEDVQENLLYLAVLKDSEFNKGDGNAPGSIKNVLFSNIRVSSPSLIPSVIEGYDAENPIENLVFQGFRYQNQQIGVPQDLLHALN